MKTTPVCSIFAGLLTACPLVMAQGPGSERIDDRDARGGELWKMVDKDQDGAISREEFANMPRLDKLPDDKRQALFDRLDKDGDGRISRVELHESKPGPDDRHPDLPRIAELDKNSDGSVSFEEFQAGPFSQRLDPERQKRIFSRLDTNGDGKISPQDKPLHRPRPDGDNGPRPGGGEHAVPEGGEVPQPDRPRPRGLIDHLDKNGDGIVTLEEFKANPRMAELDEKAVQERFRMMDRNHDGQIDRKDMLRGDGPRPGPGARPGAPAAPEGGPQVE